MNKKFNVFLFLMLMACQANSSSSSGWVFHFDRPTPVANDEITQTYNEYADYSMNYSTSQNDPRLADLFSQKYTSELCFPTTLANAFAYLFHYHTPAFDNLVLAGLSRNRTTLDGTALTRSLVSACNTDLNTGTNAMNALACALQGLRQSGYAVGDSGFITWRNFENTTNLPVETRYWTVDDIRKYLKRGDAVLLEIGWYVLDSTSNTWHRRNGHFVGVYGYRYNPSWGDSELILKVLNPNMTYATDGDAPVGDWIDMRAFSQDDGSIYPSPDAAYTLEGAGFNGKKFPVVESVMHLRPKAAVR